MPTTSLPYVGLGSPVMSRVISAPNMSHRPSAVKMIETAMGDILKKMGTLDANRRISLFFIFRFSRSSNCRLSCGLRSCRPAP